VFSISAQDFKTIQDGIEYAEMTREIDKTPVKINLLRLDLTQVRLDVVHAMDSAIGTETVSSMATRHGAIAAINAGFFRLDKSIFAGDAAGILKIDKVVLSESFQERIALLISNKPDKTEIYFDHINLRGELLIDGKEFIISGINRERKKDELIIYKPEFGRTTLTDSSGLEIIVRNNKITQILDNEGSTKIPADGFVISVSGTERNEILPFMKKNKKIRLYFSNIDFKGGNNFSYERFSSFIESEDVTNGVPQLIKEGKIEITWEQEKASKSFYETKHPRTAVAKLKDGKFLMITVDGRSEESGGIGLEDLAKLLLEFGGTDAMNLDGGGSTTMFLDGKVVNHPSDKEGERKVGDAILVFPRKKN
jgi:exopolysaccharide biosynthesis protein